jgi:phosphatidylglycerophosphate synthase
MNDMATVFDRLLKSFVILLVRLFPNVHPNWYTAIRLILIAPICVVTALDWYLMTLFLTLLAGFLDILDGPVARYKKETTRTGAFMDPLADKLLFLSLLYFFREQFEIMLLVSIVILETSLLTEHVVKFFFLRKQEQSIRKEKQKSPLPGKLKFWAEMLALLAVYCSVYFNLNLNLVGNSLLSIGVILAVYSLLNHLQVYFEKK